MPSTLPSKPAKNIVICCDGTGNQFGPENSNVVKLYTCLTVDREQVAYYHPGVGTMGAPNRSTWIGKQSSRVAGLAFGYGFTDNVASAYKFLMDQYAEGDHIYLFGFSRGAYTVRALAGALYMYGLLCPGNEGHLPYLLSMFSDESRKAYNAEGTKQIRESIRSRSFRETFSRVVPIHFLGVWDTVSSVGWIYDPVKLLFEGQNPIVRKGRHAISVDERRCFFQDNLWGSPLPPEKTPLLNEHYDSPADHQQDILQVWFPGVHSDVGGSYKQSQSGPAMNAFRWMLQEAEADGLQLHHCKRKAILGHGCVEYPALSALNQRAQPHTNCFHPSLTWKWWPLELFPHKYFDEAGKKHWRWVPWPHRRELPDGAILHPSVRERLELDPKYRPSNLPECSIRNFAESEDLHLSPAALRHIRGNNYAVFRTRTRPARSRAPQRLRAVE